MRIETHLNLYRKVALAACLISFVGLSACKKKSPSTLIDPIPPSSKKDYKDFELARMAVVSGYLLTDTNWQKNDIAGFQLKRDFDREFLYSDDNNSDLFLGNIIDGQAFINNNGSFKAYTKYPTKPLDVVSTNAYESNQPRNRYDVKIKKLTDMEDLARDYLAGTKPSLYDFCQYLHYPFSNYNQLRLLFGEDKDIAKLLKLNAGKKLSEVENGIVYYNRKETFSLKFTVSPQRSMFERPFDVSELLNNKAGYIKKVTYGKISLMTVESKLPWRELRSIISKASDKQNLSTLDIEVLKATQVYTYLKGFKETDQQKLNDLTDTSEKIKLFISITNEPTSTNGFSSGTFTYGDYGVPVSYEVNDVSSPDHKFLEKFNYTKQITF